jgi:hypothetical protein
VPPVSSQTSGTWAKATPTERSEIAGSLFTEVRVRDERLVSASIARDEYRALVASATARAQVSVARPEVAEREVSEFKDIGDT